MSIPVGVTPTFTLTFTDNTLDLTQASHVYVTFKCGTVEITKKDSALTVAEKTIEVSLTQAESLKFMPTSVLPNPPKVAIQANWTYAGGGRAASNVVFYQFSLQLLDEVVD